MSIGGNLFAGQGFARSIVSSILAQNTREIVWPIVDQQGAPVISPDGFAQSSGLFGYVALLEDHRDELQITREPVEQGSVIQDHAFLLPSQLTLRIGWTSSSAQANGLPGFLGFTPLTNIVSGFGLAGNNSYIKQVYKKLLSLQAQRTLLTIYTGKRVQRNMLLRMINERTTKETENALIITAELETIILAYTTVIQVPTNASAQAAPQDTSPIAPQGQQTVQPAPSFAQVEV